VTVRLQIEMKSCTCHVAHSYVPSISIHQYFLHKILPELETKQTIRARVRECASARVRECASARERECASAPVRQCASARLRVRCSNVSHACIYPIRVTLYTCSHTSTFSFPYRTGTGQKNFASNLEREQFNRLVKAASLKLVGEDRECTKKGREQKRRNILKNSKNA
jgi:hypothetical protein